MEWSDAIEESLPAPRDDEPADLRRDIADELGDHLACAMQREQAQTSDDEAAKAAVIERFGSPQSIARRLWWDAMKEKIMSQRLTLAAAGVAMAACLAVAVMAWLTFQQTREVNLAIIAKLEALAAPQPVAAPQSLEWTEVRFRLVQENEDGPPAEGFRVELMGRPINAASEGTMTLKRTVEGNGRVSFGPIRPGQYQYDVFSPWDQTSTGELIALPGPNTEATIICPSGPTPEGTVKFDLNWPDELKVALKEHKDLDMQDLWVQCTFEPFGGHSKAELGGHDWYSLWESFGVTVSSDGELVLGQEFRDPTSVFSGGPGGVRPRGPGAFSYDLNQLASAETLKWPIGEYSLIQVVLFSHESDPQNPERTIVTTIAGKAFSSSEQPTLQVKAGQENTWTIELPVIDLQPPPAGGAAGGALPARRAPGPGSAALPGRATPAAPARPADE